MSSGYAGRRAPNVSQYLANLNTIPSTTHEQLASEINLGEGDLDFLTNAEFFDFDSFHPPPNNVEHHTPHYNGGHNSSHARSPANGGPYQFGEFQAYPTPVTPSSGANGLHGQYPPQPNHQLPYSAPAAGDKRKASVTASIASPQDLEEQSRMAAEEDKRRRNTAASARFRVKKKQREQALEKQAKDMTDKVTQLEGKVQQLEMENKWLKELITDKGDGKNVELALREKAADDRNPSDHTTGVGTERYVEEEDEEEDAEDEDAEADI